MIRLVSRATLFLALGLLVAGAAMAGVPNAANSSIPASGLGIFITGASDPTQNFAITVRDAANNPVNNSVVVIKFVGSNCADYVQLETTQAGVNCAAGTVSRTTNASGVAVFHIAGRAREGATLASPQFCATITADGVPLGSAIASVFDLQVPGNAGVNATDLGLLVCKILQISPGIPCTSAGVVAGYQGRFDLNRDTAINATDLGRMVTALVPPNAPTTTSAATVCP